MKKILLISYGDYDYDGRLRELMKIFNEIGTLFCFTKGSVPQYENHELFFGKGYLDFIRKAVSYGKRLEDVDIIVLDNRKPVIPGLILKKVMKPKVIIQDCRELYISKDVKHLTGKLGCYFEAIMIKKADIIICANQERADIMKYMYELKNAPLVYENLRQLEYSDNANEEYSNKYRNVIKEGEFRIISTSGCSISRTNDVLINNIKNIKHNVRVFLVGSSSHSDIDSIKKICAKKNIDNVEIIGNLNQNELKWLINQSHIGIVNYHQKDLNNKYCASGKLYEFIYEGKPVITTTNPPLMNLCNRYNIGISDDEYYNGINHIIENYDLYKRSVNAFAQDNTVKANNEQLIDSLKKCIDVTMNSSS